MKKKRQTGMHMYISDKCINCDKIKVRICAYILYVLKYIMTCKIGNKIPSWILMQIAYRLKSAFKIIFFFLFLTKFLSFSQKDWNYLYVQGLSVGSINRVEFIPESCTLFRNFNGLLLISAFYSLQLLGCCNCMLQIFAFVTLTQFLSWRATGGYLRGRLVGDCNNPDIYCLPREQNVRLL